MASNELNGPPPTKRPRLSEPLKAEENRAQDAKISEKGAFNGAELADEEEEEEVMLDLEEEARPSDLYLDTINRLALDFDFEKLCSVSLSNIHVYACLVCGKYFQGRGKSSYAYAHSVHEDHHVFMNLESSKVYILPDGYEVSDPSLKDITRVLHPTFDKKAIAALSKHHLKTSYDLSETAYIPGYIGLNNIKHNDHLNVVIHLLSHVPPIRNTLLLMPPPSQTSPSSAKTRQTELVVRLSTLVKKLWSSTLFKAQVSPHEFLQEVNRASKGKFRLEQQGDPGEFVSWLLNKLHADLGGTKKPNSSIVYKSFRGTLRVESQSIKSTTMDDPATTERKPKFDSSQITVNNMPFLFLALDLPPSPVFQDAVEKNIIPQVTLQSLLEKYDGVSTQAALGTLKRYKLTSLPPYIIMHYKRFTKNNFVEEKNPTIVNFPLRGVDLREFLDTGSSPAPPSTIYDLLSNVTHESTAGTTRDKANTVWKIHLRDLSNSQDSEDDEQWFQIQDLIVEEVRREMIFLGETVLQVWQRRDVA